MALGGVSGCTRTCCTTTSSSPATDAPLPAFDDALALALRSLDVYVSDSVSVSALLLLSSLLLLLLLLLRGLEL